MFFSFAAVRDNGVETTCAGEKDATWLRTSLPPPGGVGPGCLAKVHITSQVMHTIHHRQPDGVCGLSAAGVCERTRQRASVCACGGGAGCCWRAAALPAGVAFNWNTLRAAPSAGVTVKTPTTGPHGLAPAAGYPRLLREPGVIKAFATF